MAETETQESVADIFGYAPDEDKDELSPREKANALRLHDATTRQVDHWANDEAQQRREPPRRVIEERDKTVSEVLTEHLGASSNLTGAEAYNALMNTRTNVLKAALRQSAPLSDSFFTGSKGNRDTLRKEIYEGVSKKYNVPLDGFVVTPEKREKVPALGAGGTGDMFSDLNTLGEQVTPARIAPLYDHGTELHYQSILNKEVTWGEYDDNDFVALAEIYADRHPDYKNSDEFEAISTRAGTIRKKMALKASQGTEMNPMGRLTHDLTSPAWMSFAETFRSALPVPVADDEQLIRDTARTLYHLEGEDFGTEKTVGLLAGSLGVYGAVYKQLAKKGLTKFFGESAKQKIKMVGATAAAEVGVNEIYNPEGHSLISHIFNEGEPNKMLSIGEAILIGSVFNFGFDKVRAIKGMKRHEVVGYLENKLPHGKDELAIINPNNPPPGWHKLRKNDTEIKDAVVEEAWAKAEAGFKESVPRLETKEPLLLENLSWKDATQREIEINAARHEFLADHARKLREKARLAIHSGRREEGMLLFKESQALDAERLAIKPTGQRPSRRGRAWEGQAEPIAPSGEMPLGPRVARRQEAEARTGFVEDIGRGGEATPMRRTTQDMVDDVVAGQAKHVKRLEHMDESLRVTDDVMSQEIGGFKALVDEIPADVMDSMREQVARMSRPSEVYERVIKEDAARLRKIIHHSQKALKTSDERIAFAKAAAEQAEAVAPKTPTTKGATVTPIKGGLRVDPHTQQAFADIATREMMTIPHVFKELALRSGFGFTTATAAEDAGYDNWWGAFMFGFSQFNPQFARIRGYNLHIADPIKASGNNLVNRHIEQIASRLWKIHPRLSMRLMRFETIAHALPVMIKKETGAFFHVLDDATEKGIITAETRSKFSHQLLDEGRSLRTREEIRKLGEQIATDGRGLIQRGEELTEQFNKSLKALDNLRKEGLSVGMKIGKIDNYFARSVRKDKIKDFNKAMGIKVKSLEAIEIARYEKEHGVKLGKLPFQQGYRIRQSIRNKVLNDMHSGARLVNPPSNIKTRKMERIKKEHAEFYERDAVSWGNYIDMMVHEIQKERLLGNNLKNIKGPVTPAIKARLDDTYGGIMQQLEAAGLAIPKGTVIKYADGTTRTLKEDTFFNKLFIGDFKQLAKGEERRLAKLQKRPEKQRKKFEEQTATATHLMQRRFAGAEGRIDDWHNVARALTHALTIGQFTSTITQAGDMGVIMQTEGVRAALEMFGEASEAKVKEILRHLRKGNFAEATSDNLIYSRDGLGFGALGAEFFQVGKRNGWVAGSEEAAQAILKYTGFRAFDDIMKNTKLNATLSNLRKGIKSKTTAGGKTTYEVSPEIRARFGKAFGKDFDDLVQAVANKDWDNWNVKTAVVMELGKVQPITMSNMPVAYLQYGGFGRFCYTVKTFQMTYINHLRRAVLSKMYHGAKKKDWKQVGEGATNLGKLFVYFGGINYGVNNLNNFINGREFDPEGTAVAALLAASGLSKYQIYDAQRTIEREGFVSGLGITGFKTIMPAAVSPLNALGRDIWSALTDDKFKLENLNIIKHLPFVGRPLEGRLRDESKGTGRRSRKAPSRGSGGRSAPSRGAPSR